jgi:adenylate kinase family enzyme
VERIAIIGSPGSGKTTLGRALATRIDARFVELDGLHHGPNWSHPSAAQLRAAVAEALDTERWVADGNYRRVADLTQMRADTIVWLDLPRRQVTWRVWKRAVGRIVRREELWNGNRETWRDLLSPDPERSVVVWTWQQHRKFEERYAAQLDEKIWAHADVYRLRSQDEIEAWLGSIPGTTG